MIIIQNTLVSEDIIRREFVCKLSSCKGECCVEGDAGAPLEKEEVSEIAANYEQIKLFMRPIGHVTIQKQGFYEIDDQGDLVTPLIDNKECAFVYFDRGIAKCAIEKAYFDREIPFRKPVSCHLYPIRISVNKEYDALNYHQWPVCKSAMKYGKKIGVPVYKFLEEPLISKYGKDWYDELCQAAEIYKKKCPS